MRAVILGSGPAGSSCAIQLLKAGFQVTILERKKFPRNMPGETLHPGVEELLKQLDVFKAVEARKFIRHRGIQIADRQGERLEFYNKEADWRGFQLYRKDFDGILLEKALFLGADYHEEIRARNVSCENDLIKGIVTDSRMFAGDIFIDATGRNSWLARRMKIKYRACSPKLLVYYGYVKAKPNNDFAEPHLIWDSSGWTWISRINGEIICWNRLNLSSSVSLPNDWMPEELASYQKLEPRKAVDATWKAAETMAGKNYFLLGDSAFTLDPLSSHGVIKALMSGILLAHLLKLSGCGYLSKKHLRERYQVQMKSWFEKDIQALKKVYAANGFDINI